MITQERLKKLLHYSPDTGIFTWKVNRQGGVAKGDIAGHYEKKGYIVITIDEKRYRGHRLAFLYMVGYFPLQVDHKDHSRKNNKWKNLRPASDSINSKNKTKRKDNKSGVTGVSFDKRKIKWVACIGVNGKTKHLGVFEFFEEAVKARKAAEKKYEYHRNHGV